MGRHELREQVFKLLFRKEFNPQDQMEEQKKLFLDDWIEETEGKLLDKDGQYVLDRYGLIEEKLAELDQLIDDNTEGWDTTRMGKVELTVLRLAVYEICFDENIPNSVAINEAVEIAKKYGQENSGSFVNAILGKIVKLGESNS